MKKAVKKRSMSIPPVRESACQNGGVRALQEGKTEGSFGAGELKSMDPMAGRFSRMIPVIGSDFEIACAAANAWRSREGGSREAFLKQRWYRVLNALCKQIVCRGLF